MPSVFSIQNQSEIERNQSKESVNPNNDQKEIISEG